MTSVRPRRIAGNIAYWDGHRERLVDAIGPDVVKFFDDFTLSSLAAADAPVGWTVTLVEAGAGESTITKPDGSGGHLLLTTDANEDDGINMQAAGESFGFASGQTATYFGIRFKSGEATQSDILVGLCITDTTLLGGLSDGVYFEKLDGGTGISFVTEKNSTETQTDSLGTLAADTWTTLEFYGDSSSVRAYIDGTLVATHTTNICDDELLTPSIHFLSGNAAVETMTIDWVRALQIGRS
jgi:prepilin-type processing-associated H-X9-DG protein